MNGQDAQVMKDEMAQLAIRLDNIEGYFHNFDVTLGNHMSDYRTEQEAQAGRLGAVEAGLKLLGRLFNLGFWVTFGLLVLVLGAGGALLVVLAMEYLKAKGG